MKCLLAVVAAVLVIGCSSNKVKFEDDPHAPPPMVSVEKWETCIKAKSRSEWDRLNCGI